MTQEELNEVIEKHRRWWVGEEGGQRADLRGTCLQGANLRGAYLRGANLRGADLRGACLRGACLQGADLQGANLRGAYLRGADLRGADLRGAYLPIWCKWGVSHKTDGTIRIGCEEASIEEWDKFFYESDKKIETDRYSEAFKRIRSNYEAVKAYVKIMYDL